MIVGHVFPDFWAGIVGSASLSSQHASLSYFGNVQVTELYHTTFGDENVGALDVTMTDLQVVKCLKTPHDLDKVVPDFLLAEPVVDFLLLSNKS